MFFIVFDYFPKVSHYFSVFFNGFSLFFSRLFIVCLVLFFFIFISLVFIIFLKCFFIILYFFIFFISVHYCSIVFSLLFNIFIICFFSTFFSVFIVCFKVFIMFFVSLNLMSTLHYITLNWNNILIPKQTRQKTHINIIMSSKQSQISLNSRTLIIFSQNIVDT